MTDLERTLWRAMLDADLGKHYYSKLAGRYHDWDLRLKCFLAIVSSSTVAGWSFWTDSDKYPHLVVMWKVLSALSAIVAIVMPLMNLAKKVEWATNLQHSYSKILSQYELHWAQIASLTPNKTILFLQDMSRSESALAPLESHFPKQDDALVRECQCIINRKRGLIV